MEYFRIYQQGWRTLWPLFCVAFSRQYVSVTLIMRHTFIFYQYLVILFFIEPATHIFKLELPWILSCACRDFVSWICTPISLLSYYFGRTDYRYYWHLYVKQHSFGIWTSSTIRNYTERGRVGTSRAPTFDCLWLAAETGQSLLF